MKINRARKCPPPKLTLGDLKPGETFEKVCGHPQAIYLVLNFVMPRDDGHPFSEARCRHIARNINESRYPLADLTNNRALSPGHIPLCTEVRRVSVELCVTE